ncbi:MAG: hypothetical protein ABIR06_18185 [Cyclobacteriaceae bacterium]
MKLRCSPYNPVYFVVFLGILVVCLTSFAHAQCQADFTYQSYSSEKKSPSGKIEITLKTSDSPMYTFKVYQVEGAITLVQTKQASLRDKVTIEHLKPSTYFVRIEWGESCYKTIGGLDGIIITAKDQ